MNYVFHKQCTLVNIGLVKISCLKSKERYSMPPIVLGCLVSGLEEQK
jgi:hypothetical protein